MLVCYIAPRITTLFYYFIVEDIYKYVLNKFSKKCSTKKHYDKPWLGIIGIESFYETHFMSSSYNRVNKL